MIKMQPHPSNINNPLFLFYLNVKRKPGPKNNVGTVTPAKYTQYFESEWIDFFNEICDDIKPLGLQRELRNLTHRTKGHKSLDHKALWPADDRLPSDDNPDGIYLLKVNNKDTRTTSLT